jgi:hypothetical protein
MPNRERNEQPRALNFSYVLNEPCVSRSVRRAVRLSGRFEGRRGAISRRFERMSDSELQACVIVEPPLLDQLRSADRVPNLIFTPSVGLPALLPRVLRLFNQYSTAPQVATIDLPFGGEEETEINLFGHPARMNASINRADAVLALIVMPNARTLLLSGSFEAPVPPVIERLVRDFSDQWTPERALWYKPAELADPEIRSLSDTHGSR